LVLALTLLASACSGSDDGAEGGDDATSAPTTAPTTEESSDDGGEAEPSVVISSGSETISIGGGDLPEGWPEEFPLPDGAEVAGSASQPDNYVVWFSGGGASMDDLRSFFEEELPANGWNIESTMDLGGDGFAVYTITGNGYTGGVYVGEGAPGAEGFEGDYAFWVALTAE
jgi:hypothetical protein